MGTEEEKAKELEAVRREIDDIDDHLVKILERRASCMERVFAAKESVAGSSVRDYVREHEVLDRVLSQAVGAFPLEGLRRVFSEIIAACRSLQETAKIRFLGPVGSFTHIAAKEVFGVAATFEEATTIAGVFEVLTRADADFGVIPVESSYKGAIDTALDAMLEYEVRINREITMPLNYCLLSSAKTLSGIECLYAPVEALEICRPWIVRNIAANVRLTEMRTAAAMREASADSRAATIAPSLTSDIYNLPIVCENIQEPDKQWMRYLIVAREDHRPVGNDKTSIAVSFADDMEGLSWALDMLRGRRIPVFQINPRPARNVPWRRMYLLDLGGHRTEPRLSRALEELTRRASAVRLLGSYPVWQGSQM